ncbi:LysR substrate-binding domain-containing protein [Mesorhizobium newzealandense]|uniref:LysR substrate-binding domain-containing protein n=1 Tax=Mesorhizobium newzealandense TaxID=1300302 RepID=A0ABW4UID9_9HYPH
MSGASRAPQEKWFAVKPSGPLRANTSDGSMPLLYAGMGIAVVPEFMIVEELADGRIERLLDGWALPGGAIHWVTPPGTRRHLRVNLLGEYLAAKLAGKNGVSVRAASNESDGRR